MQVSEVKEILKVIDVNYDSNYCNDSYYLDEWYRDLKDYDYEDVMKSLDNHLKSNYSNIRPKKWALLNPLKTIKQKEAMATQYSVCPFCKKVINLIEYDHHYGRCLDIEFIEKYVKKYTGKEIEKDKYYNFTDEELKEKFDKCAKIVIEKEPDTLTTKCLKNYFNQEPDML